MKLQTKFTLAILVIFAVVAVLMAALTVYEVNTLVIGLAENRVKIYMRAAWEIMDAKIARTRAALEILAQDRSVVDVLAYGGVPDRLRPFLESVRRDQKMDVLNVLSPDGKVMLRTRAPYNNGDNLANDPLVRQVLATKQPAAGYIVMDQERLDVEGSELVERTLAVGGEARGMLAGVAVPVIENGKLVGIIEMGGLINGATEKVDAIRDAVFANEIYNGKPVGTATIFLDDLRISTNVLDQAKSSRRGHTRLEGSGRQCLAAGRAVDGPGPGRRHPLSRPVRPDPRSRRQDHRDALCGRAGAEVQRPAAPHAVPEPGRDPRRHGAGLPGDLFPGAGHRPADPHPV